MIVTARLFSVVNMDVACIIARSIALLPIIICELADVEYVTFYPSCFAHPTHDALQQEVQH